MNYDFARKLGRLKTLQKLEISKLQRTEVN